LNAALETLNQVVRARPNWAQAVALRGMLEQRLGRLEEALADFEAAVRLGESRLAVFERLIALLDHFNRGNDADQYLARLESQLPVSQRLTELVLAREVMRERPASGLELARRSAVQRPHDARAQVWLARLLSLNEQPVEAEQAYLKAVELAPADLQVYSSLLSFYSRGEYSVQVRALADRVSASRVLSAAHKSLLLGEAHELLGDRDAAGTHFAAAAGSAGDDVATRLRIAQFYIQSDPQQAKEQLEAALRIDAKSVRAKRMLAVAHAALGDLPAAEALLAAADEGGVSEAADVRLRGVLLAQQGGQANLAKAIGLLEEVVARGSGGQPVDRLLLGRLYEQQAGLTRDLAAAQARREKAAEQLLHLASKPAPDPTHLAALIEFYQRQANPAEADRWLKTLEQRVAAIPADKLTATAVALLVQTQILTRSVGGSERWLQKLEAIDKAPLRPTVLRARVAQILDPQADVEAMLETKLEAVVAAATPAEQQRWLATAGEVYLSLAKHQAAEKWLRRLIAVAPEQYPVLVTALSKQGKLREAIELCAGSEALEESPRAALTIAGVLIGGAPTPEDHAAAEPVLARALAKFPTNIAVVNALAVVRAAQQKDQESIDLFRKLVQMNPRAIVALNNLAMLLADRPQDRQEALRLIDQAIAIAGEDAGLLDTKGAILVYCGRSSEAIPLLESATRDSQADPRHHFHLALAYQDQGQSEQAKAQLQKALSRQLSGQLLTLTDQKLLSNLRAALQL
jgi:tetratricopeptide (TPR) repeat protein